MDMEEEALQVWHVELVSDSGHALGFHHGTRRLTEKLGLLMATKEGVMHGKLDAVRLHAGGVSPRHHPIGSPHEPTQTDRQGQL